MLQTRELFDSLASRADHLDNQILAATADALSQCEQAVTACATGMLAEKEADELRVAINRDLDCADVASATRRVLTRGTDADHRLLTTQLEACTLACERSHELCSQHARHHEHCRLCSQATERAITACHKVLQALRP
ncbi:hypothetical protein [Streptomyces kanamyceticus]|uniref:Four-helix bundle copper-binding protein n=1 Tax=Streptomyces kanamyceticus TaxID=1967 RepID=A0A5J6G4H6_STRKN|nr:hypothetical protein [Streptomyces kanamyceticus]QEU89807.1 hypothetical protein CP970_01560 [Streptomyces kanamyceticus]